MGRKRKHGKHLPRRVYASHGAYYFVGADGRWRHLGRSYSEAMAAYGRLMEGFEGPLRTMGQVFERYELEVVPTKAERTQADNRRELGLLRKVFAHMPPAAVRARHIYGYMDRRPPVRANRERALLSDVFSHAIRWGAVEENPCREVRTYPEKPRRRYVTDAEFWAVYELAPPVVRSAMMLSLLLGLRLGELLRLRRDQLADDGILVQSGKGGASLLFEWTDELEEAVAEAKRIKRPVRSLHLLCNRKGQAYTVSGFGSMWQKVIRRALDKEKLAERFRFHDLRAKSGSDHDTGEHLGHQDQRTLNRVYRRKPRRVRPVAVRRAK